MKMVDTKSGTPFRVRVNRTGRRTYSREYKLDVVEECEVPGASVAAVALSHRINANLVRRWIVRHRKGRLVREPSATLLPVTVSAPSARTEVVLPRGRLAGAGVIEIELEAGRVRVRGMVDATTLRMVLEVLAKR